MAIIDALLLAVLCVPDINMTFSTIRSSDPGFIEIQLDIFRILSNTETYIFLYLSG